MNHLHLLAKNQNGELAGAAQPQTPDEIRQLLAGTGYRDEPGLIAVINGTIGRGYHVNDDGTWVALTDCPGQNSDQCAEHLTSVVVFADIRAAKHVGLM